MLNRSTGFPSHLLSLLLFTFPFVPLGLEAQSSFKAEVRLIQIEARVTRDGKPVTGLNKEDFILKENGMEREVAFLTFIPGPSGIQLEETQAPAADAIAEAVLRPQASPGEPSWIYLLPEAGDSIEFHRTAQAIREFIGRDLPPGCFFSLGGLPYTDHQDLLLYTLDRLENHPYGKGGAIPPELLRIQMLEDLRRLVRTEASGARQGGSSLITIDEESLIAGSSMDPIESIAWVSRQIAYYSELAIFRYMDLVERMALLPGKKSVVLFRSGLRMDRESSPLMNRLLAAAVRNRVAFYTIDTRGLKDSSPDQPSGAMALAARMYRYLPDPMHDNRRLIESQEGLAVLAEDTGGQAVLNNNNPGEILSRVVEDSHAYYVLSFYPGEPSRKGKFRKIEVSLRNQDGCRISCVPGYHDLGPLPEQNSGERLLSLKEAMLTSSSRELRLSIEPEVLADPEGNPLLCLSAAVPAEDFIPAGKKGKLKIEAELLLQLVNKYSLNMPLYANAQLKHTVKTDEPAGGGEVSRLSYRTALSLVPGQYQLKGIVRDRESGRHGVFSTWITVSDFNNAASVPSSLILTRYAVPLDPDNRDDQVNRVLAVGDTVYYPQAEREFQRGEVVYALFRLYHATPEDRAWASRGIQTGLIRDDALVDKLLIHGNTHSDPGSDILTYLLMFETVNLDPGEYTFVVMLPNHPARVRQQLEETLRIIP